MNVSRSRNEEPKPSKHDIVEQLKLEGSADNSSGKSSSPTSQKPKHKPVRRNRDKSKRQVDVPGFKLVVRFLPPNMGSEEFYEITKGYINEQNVVDKYYVPGKYPRSKTKPPVHSRCYVKFKTLRAAEEFSAKYSSQPFQDEEESFLPVITKALFDKMPVTPKKTANTIDGSKLAAHPFFKLFVEWTEKGDGGVPPKFMTKRKGTSSELEETNKKKNSRRGKKNESKNKESNREKAKNKDENKKKTTASEKKRNKSEDSSNKKKKESKKSEHGKPSEPGTPENKSASVSDTKKSDQQRRRSRKSNREKEQSNSQSAKELNNTKPKINETTKPKLLKKENGIPKINPQKISILKRQES